jgi:phenylacetate-CoA ligase
MEEVTYWNKEMETLPREKLEALQLQRFRERMQYVYERSPMYRRKYDEEGIRPSDIQSLEDIQNVPFTVKEELRESQVKQPP